MPKNPCGATKAFWLQVRQPRTATPGDECGKWLLFIDCPWVNKVWLRVVEDVRAGLLGPSAKISTCKSGSPLARRKRKHVVCVYTRDWADRADVERVAQRLVVTGELKRAVIQYKRDEETLAGQYAWNSSGVALYRFGPPYREITSPTSASRKRSAVEADDEWNEDDSFYFWPYGPE